MPRRRPQDPQVKGDGEGQVDFLDKKPPGESLLSGALSLLRNHARLQPKGAAIPRSPKNWKTRLASEQWSTIVSSQNSLNVSRTSPMVC